MKFESIRGGGPQAPRFLSVAEVAKMFGLSPMTVYRAMAAGEFPAVKIRGQLIVSSPAGEWAPECLRIRSTCRASPRSGRFRPGRPRITHRQLCQRCAH